MSAMLSRLMADPAMKEMMRSQQRSIVQKMYGPLLEELNLTPDQKERFFQVMSDSQTAATDHAAKLFGSDAAAKAGAMAALKEQNVAMEDQIRTVLGDEKYAQYQDYKKTMGDRMAFDDFKQQLEGGTMALTDQQSAGLLQVMAEERTKVAPAVPQSVDKMPTDFTAFFSSEVLEKQLDWQADFDRRVLERAGAVLTPEQLQELAAFQRQQLNMQTLSMKMATEFLGGDKAAPAPANPAPAR